MEFKPWRFSERRKHEGERIRYPMATPHRLIVLMSRGLAACLLDLRRHPLRMFLRHEPLDTFGQNYEGLGCVSIRPRFAEIKILFMLQ